MASIERPPVIAVMGHVDHGKSTLLDYIRNTNVVDSEAGGITQHVSAYEVEHTDPQGVLKRMTFIDTPGHAAFTSMRERGAHIADIAILIVSAEDSVKMQTKEAISIIKKSGVPYVVAINKIDRPNANPEKVKNDLMVSEVYLEGFGGDIPFAEISAKTGQGVDELLETILLLAELEEFKGDDEKPAEGFIVESHLDPKRGLCSTLIIKDGLLSKGDYIVAGCGLASTRIFENFAGKKIESALFSSPIKITGFSSQCGAGAEFKTFSSKKDAEAALVGVQAHTYVTQIPTTVNAEKTNIIPVILKTDVEGMLEAAAAQIEALSSEGIFFKIVKTGVGDINESDIQTAASHPGTLVLGFSVAVDNKIYAMNAMSTPDLIRDVQTFSIIYKMSEWVESMKEDWRFKEEFDEVTAEIKLLKIFSQKRNDYLVGGRVTLGTIKKGYMLKVVDAKTGEKLGMGKVGGMKQAREDITVVTEGKEFGMMFTTKASLVEGHLLQAFVSVIK